MVPKLFWKFFYCQLVLKIRMSFKSLQFFLSSLSKGFLHFFISRNLHLNTAPNSKLFMKQWRYVSLEATSVEKSLPWSFYCYRFWYTLHTVTYDNYCTLRWYYSVVTHFVGTDLTLSWCSCLMATLTVMGASQPHSRPRVCRSGSRQCELSFCLSRLFIVRSFSTSPWSCPSSNSSWRLQEFASESLNWPITWTLSASPSLQPNQANPPPAADASERQRLPGTAESGGKKPRQQHTDFLSSWTFIAIMLLKYF